MTSQPSGPRPLPVRRGSLTSFGLLVTLVLLGGSLPAGSEAPAQTATARQASAAGPAAAETGSAPETGPATSRAGAAQTEAAGAAIPAGNAKFAPLIERYILDELKQLRQDQQAMQATVTERLAAARLDATDRAVNYTTSTINNVFFIITAAASILVLVGWNSLRDVKSRIDDMVERRINEISHDYEERLTTLEARLKRRSQELIAAQEEITKTNTMHALWMRAGLETSPQAKIEILDQILELNPEDAEALCYKADAILAIGEPRWALNLCDRVLAIDHEYANGHWQRACAMATLGFVKEALEGIRTALTLSPTLREELAGEGAFETLHGHEAFRAMLPEETAPAASAGLRGERPVAAAG
jgi:tetratricopeptide (TPR) repeat protein